MFVRLAGTNGVVFPSCARTRKLFMAGRRNCCRVLFAGRPGFFEADTLTPLCGAPLATCDGATPDDVSACWASAVPATRRQRIKHAISDAGNFIVSPPDWSVSLPRRKRRWPLRKKSLLTPTLAHTIRVASVWPPFDLTARPSPPHCWPPNLVQSDVD